MHELLPGQELIPNAGLLTKLIYEAAQYEQQIQKIAAKSAPFFPTPHAGMVVTINVGGKPYGDFALDYLTALWPEALSIKVPVLVAYKDTLSISASQPCTVVLFGCENKRDR